MRLLELALACATMFLLTVGAVGQDALSLSIREPSAEQVPGAPGHDVEAASVTVNIRSKEEDQERITFPAVAITWLDTQKQPAGGVSLAAPAPPADPDEPPKPLPVLPSAAEPSTEPPVKLPAEPVAKPAAEPAESVAEPSVKPVAEPAESAAEPVPPATSESGTTYSKDGQIYSKDRDGYLYVTPAPHQPPRALPPVNAPPTPPPPRTLAPLAPLPLGPPPASPGNVRIDWNCAAGGMPLYEVVTDTILWRLEHTRGQPVVQNPLLGQVTWTDDLDFGLGVGPRVNVRCRSEESEDISGFEVGYFGVYDWSDSMMLVAPEGTYLRLPDTLGNVGETIDFSQADRMYLYSDSRLDSVEANLLFGDPMADFHLVFGPRYIRLEETFTIDSFTADRRSVYDVATRDSLWGLQLGAEWRHRRRCWELSSFLKVGAYSNSARQRTFLADNDRTEVLRNFYYPKDTVNSFVLDAGVNLTRWITDVWLVRAGYSVLWMDNIARAADQLDFSSNAVSGSGVYFRQDALAHGLNFGLEARW